MNASVNRVPSDDRSSILYLVCDLLFAAILGVLVASTVPVLLGQSLPMFPRMMLAMVIGMLMVTPVTILGAIPLGMFETMTYGMWTGMLAAMLGVMDMDGNLLKLEPGIASAAIVWFFFSLLNRHYRSKGLQFHNSSKAPEKKVPVSRPGKKGVVWDRLAALYDLVLWGSERRQRSAKKKAFSQASGRVLFVGAGTGMDLLLVPQDVQLFALDISKKMLEKAKKRARQCGGTVHLIQSDIQEAPFPDNSFDSVLTSCVFCSVPDPVMGLEEVRRVLKPGGNLIMFEHVLSRNPLLSCMLRAMNHLTTGPDLTRDTVGNVFRAGLAPVTHRNIYMDIVKVIEIETQEH